MAQSILGNVDINNMSLRSKNDATERLASETEDLLRRVDALPTLDSRPEGEGWPAEPPTPFDFALRGRRSGLPLKHFPLFITPSQ